MTRLLALASAVVWMAGPAAAEPVGFVAYAEGDVAVQQAGAWSAARRDAPIEIGDAIRTGEGASAKIVLVDDTLLQIDEETELRIESFHVGDAATKETSLVRQARGRLRATVGEAFGASTKLEVHIPTAAIGIKGTDFEVREDGLWEACLHTGGILVRNTYGAAAPRPGECVYAYADRAPGDPHPNALPPFEAGKPGDGKRPVATTDFLQPIQVNVAAPPTVEGQVQDPPTVVVDPQEPHTAVVDPQDPHTAVVDPQDPHTAVMDDLANQPDIEIEMDPPGGGEPIVIP